MLLFAGVLLRVTILVEQQLEEREPGVVSEALAAVAGLLTLAGVSWLYSYILDWVVPVL